jgi:hypothetical protein
MRRRGHEVKLSVVLAGLLAMNIAVQLTQGSVAVAQPGAQSTPQPFGNSAEFQRRTADGIGQLVERMGRIEARLEKPFNVKVLEMPPIQVNLPKTAN